MKRFFSILLIVSLACSVALFGSGSAFATAGDASGNFADFPIISCNLVTLIRYIAGSSNYQYFFNRSDNFFTVFVLFPSPVSSGVIDISSYLSLGSNVDFVDLTFYSITGVQLGYFDSDSVSSVSVPSGSSFVALGIELASSISGFFAFYPSYLTYSSFVYDVGSGGEADLSTIEDLLSFSYHTYTTYSGAYDWTNHQFASTSTWNDFGSAFQSLLYSNSGAAILLTQLMVGDGTNTYSLDGVTYNNLPAYLIALGNKVSLSYSAQANTQALMTSRFNSVDSDLDVLLTNSATILAAVGDLRSGVRSALYADYPNDTDENKSPWSVAQWLRGIYDAVTSFVSSFWSPAEQDLKEVNEASMQQLADSNMNVSASNVSDLGSVSPDVMSSLSTSVSPSSAFDLISDSNSPVFFFWSQECMDAMDTTASGSASLQSDDEPEPSFVDQNDAWRRELLGGVTDD